MTAFRIVVVLGILALVALVMIGAIYFTSTDDSITITVDKDKIRGAAGAAKEEARDAMRKTGKAVERAGENLQQGADRVEPREGQPDETREPVDVPAP